MERLAPRFSSGVAYTLPYDTTEFVRVSIEEVVKTLLIAIGLVILTVYVFLQNWRTTLIPTLTSRSRWWERSPSSACSDFRSTR